MNKLQNNMAIKPILKPKKRVFLQILPVSKLEQLSEEMDDMLRILQDDHNIIEDITVVPHPAFTDQYMGTITYSFTS